MTPRGFDFVAIGFVMLAMFLLGIGIGRVSGYREVATAICSQHGYLRGGYFDGETVQCDLRGEVR